MTIDVNDLLDFYSVVKLAEIWNCKCEDIIHFIRDQQSLRLACSVKGLSNQIHAIYVDDDKELIDSLVGAFNQKLPITSNSLEDGVRLHKKDIGAKQFDRLTGLSSSGSAKQKKRRISDFIYEDVVNIQWAESLIESGVLRSDHSIYAGGITWVDQDYDENFKETADLGSQNEFYVTGLNFDGDRFLLVEMDSKKEEVIIRPIRKSNFSIIPREEKERFENTTGMKTASDNGQIEPAIADISPDPITKDSSSNPDPEELPEWKRTAWQYALELLDEFPKEDSRNRCKIGIKKIGDMVAKRMNDEEEVPSLSGKPFTGNYIARHALTGLKKGVPKWQT
jgi:hypothetical protein